MKMQKGGEMSAKEITLRFDLDDEVQKRVYYALKNLPEFYKEPDMSKAVIRFIDNLVNTVGECEEQSVKCGQIIESLLIKQGDGKLKWQ
jgi:hypothetical protein